MRKARVTKKHGVTIKRKALPNRFIVRVGKPFIKVYMPLYWSGGAVIVRDDTNEGRASFKSAEVYRVRFRDMVMPVGAVFGVRRIEPRSDAEGELAFSSNELERLIEDEYLEIIK